MERTQARERFFARFNRYFIAAYALLNLGYAAYYVARGEAYYYGLAFGTLLIFPLMWAVYRIFRLRRAHQLEFIIYAFTFLAYSMGEVMRFYELVPAFDKLAHTLSGTLTALLSLPLFYALKTGHRVARTDCALAVTFAMLAALAVAGLWEIGEYLLSGVTGIDMQRTKGTGVRDTMRDMIVCSLGALAAVPSMLGYYRKGRADLLMGGFEAYAAANLPGGEAR